MSESCENWNRSSSDACAARVSQAEPKRDEALRRVLVRDRCMGPGLEIRYYTLFARQPATKVREISSKREALRCGWEGLCGGLCSSFFRTGGGQWMRSTGRIAPPLRGRTAGPTYYTRVSGPRIRISHYGGFPMLKLCRWKRPAAVCLLFSV